MSWEWRAANDIHIELRYSTDVTAGFTRIVTIFDHTSDETQIVILKVARASEYRVLSRQYLC